MQGVCFVSFWGGVIELFFFRSRVDELLGWKLPGFDDSTWQPAVVDPSPPTGALEEQSFAGEQVLQRIAPVSSHSVGIGTIYDFGVNLAGICELGIAAKNSFRLELHHAEQLWPK